MIIIKKVTKRYVSQLNEKSPFCDLYIYLDFQYYSLIQTLDNSE